MRTAAGFFAPATACRAPSSICRRASASGSSSTARVLMARSTATVRMPGAIAFTSSTAASSPVTSATATPYHAAIAAFMPPSPTDTPFTCRSLTTPDPVCANRPRGASALAW